MTVVDVLVPCETFDVTARVGPEDHATELEKLVLEAIGSGVDTIPRLSKLFGLGQRLTLDLVFDLWRSGLLLADMTSGQLELSAEADELVREGTLDALASGRARDERLEILQEQLTGHVIDPRALPGRPVIEPQAIVPVDLFDIGPQDVASTQLVEALRSVVERQSGRQTGLKILSADLAWDNMRPRGQRRFLRLRVLPTFDAQSERVAVAVLPEPAIPAHVRTALGERITQVVEEEPEARFSKWLTSVADPGPATPVDVEETLAELARRVEGLVPEAASQRIHDELTDLADRLHTALDERPPHDCDVEAVVGRTAQTLALNELIVNALKQIIIVSPWMSTATVNALVEPLRAALDNGVQVVLVAGIGTEEQRRIDEDQAFSLLEELRVRYPSRLIISKRSAHTHAKVAIADSRLALVTSRNLLSSRSEGPFELGLKISAWKDRPSSVIEDLLGWVRTAMPDWVQAQALYQHASDFRREIEGAAGDHGHGIDPPPPVPAFTQPSDGDMSDPSFRESLGVVYAARWREAVGRLEELAGRSQDGTARVVRNGEHRDILWRALRTARHRLLICSDGLSSRVVDNTFATVLGERLEAGTQAAIVWANTLDDEAAARLTALKERWGERLLLVPQANNHAKILIADDAITAGSFNFLSFEGQYQEVGGFARRQRSEISVRLHSHETADAAVQALSDEFRVDLAALVTPRTESPPTPAHLEVPAQIEEMIASVPAIAAAADAREMHRVMRQAFERSPEPAALLERLHEAALPSDAVRRATATCIAVREDDPAVGLWRSRLALEAWERQALMEAAVIAAGADTTPNGMVDPDIIAATLLFDHDDFRDALTNAALAATTADDVLAVVALATTSLVFHGDLSAIETLAMHQTEGPWQAIADLACEHWNATFLPVPVGRIRADLEHASDRDLRETARAALVDALDKGDRDFPFAAGRETRASLYSSDGVLGILRSAVERNDFAAIRRWVADHRRENLGTLLDRVTRDLQREPPVFFGGGPRRNYINRLGAIWTAAERYAHALGPIGGEDEAPVPETARLLAHGISDRWEALRGEASGNARPAAPLLDRLLDRLDLLERWNT